MLYLFVSPAIIKSQGEQKNTHAQQNYNKEEGVEEGE